MKITLIKQHGHWTRKKETTKEPEYTVHTKKILGTCSHCGKKTSAISIIYLNSQHGLVLCSNCLEHVRDQLRARDHLRAPR